LLTGSHGLADENPALAGNGNQCDLSGMEFTKLHFGRKLLREIFILKFWTKTTY
jgi:hypothetical protein